MKQYIFSAFIFFVSLSAFADFTESDFNTVENGSVTTGNYTVGAMGVVLTRSEGTIGNVNYSAHYQVSVPVTSNIGIGTNGYITVNLRVTDGTNIGTGCYSIQQSKFSESPTLVPSVLLDVPYGFKSGRYNIQAFILPFSCSLSLPLYSNIFSQPLEVTSTNTNLDVSVSEVKLAQVVYNPQSNPTGKIKAPYVPLVSGSSTTFLAVQGKSASFEVTVSKLPTTSVLSSGTFRIKIIDTVSNNVISQSGLIDYSQLNNSSKFVITADKMFPLSPAASFIPNTAGVRQYSAIVETSNTQVTNTPKAISINTIKTYAPTIEVVRVTNNFTAPPTNLTFNNYLSLSPYLSSILPVSDKAITLKDGGSVIGVPTSGEDTEIEDLRTLDRRARFDKVNRIVAIVDPKYLTSNGNDSDLRGYNYPNLSKVSVVGTKSLITFAHELAHSFGANYELSEYGETVLSNGYQGDPTGFLGTTKTLQSAYSFLDGLDSTQDLNKLPWIDDRTYSNIFNYFQNPIIDPKTVLVSGILSKNGTLSNISTISIPNGVETISETEGDLTLKALDMNNNVLQATSIKTHFYKEYESPNGSAKVGHIEVDRIPFAIEIAENVKITQIQILKDNKEILKQTVSGLTLVGIIDRMPLESFRALGCPKASETPKYALKEKEALRVIALQAQKLISSKKPASARILLEGLVLAIKVTTKAQYYTSNLDEISPANAILEIKKIIKSL
jgi:hypothetical protein